MYKHIPNISSLCGHDPYFSSWESPFCHKRQMDMPVIGEGAAPARWAVSYLTGFPSAQSSPDMLCSSTSLLPSSCCSWPVRCQNWKPSYTSPLPFQTVTWSTSMKSSIHVRWSQKNHRLHGVSWVNWGGKGYVDCCSLWFFVVIHF